MKNFRYTVPCICAAFFSSSLYASFSESLDELEKVVNSINAVFTSVLNTLNAINSLFGVEVLLLLLAVIVFSSGLSAVGMPKGKMAFFTALLISDFFWTIWITAQKPESLAFILRIVKANLILLSPYLLFLSIRTIYPLILHSIRKKIYSKRGIKKEELLKFSDDIMQLYVYFVKHMQHDLVEENDFIVLSGNTHQSLGRLIAKLNSLKKYQKSKISDDANELIYVSDKQEID